MLGTRTILGAGHRAWIAAVPISALELARLGAVHCDAGWLAMRAASVQTSLLSWSNRTVDRTVTRRCDVCDREVHGWSAIQWNVEYGRSGEVEVADCDHLVTLCLSHGAAARDHLTALIREAVTHCGDLPQ